MKKTDIDILCNIYHALNGIASETGPEEFDHFYEGGGTKMFKDFEKVLSNCGVVFKEPEYFVKEYYDRTAKTEKWGIFSDKDDPESFMLSGLESKQVAEEILKKVMDGTL